MILDNTTIEWRSGKPAEHPSLFAKLYGTPKWNKHMFRTTSDECLLTIEVEGERFVTEGRTYDGEWNCDSIRGLKIQNKQYTIVAWAPMPAPYKGEIKDV